MRCRYSGEAITSEFVNAFLKDSSIHYMTYSQCPCCTGSDFIIIAKRDLDNIPVDRVLCMQCGFIFALTFQMNNIFFYMTK